MMYKYLCVVCENADENALYDAISEIKALYRNCTEIPYTGSNKNEIGQILSITDKQGEESKIYIKYEHDKRRVVVLSENYLFKYFEDKSVKEVSAVLQGKFDFRMDLLFGAVFFIINMAVVLLIHSFFAVMTALMAIFYSVSANWLKKRYDISYVRIFIMQLGGSVLIIPLSFFSVFAAYLLMCFAYLLPAWLLSTGAAAFMNKEMKGRNIFFSLAFLVINYLVIGISAYSKILFAAAAAIYVVFALKMKKETSHSMFYICFIQYGHIFAVIINIALAIMAYEVSGLAGLGYWFLALLYCIYVPIILAVSAIITLIIRKISRSKQNKLNSNES